MIELSGEGEGIGVNTSGRQVEWGRFMTKSLGTGGRGGTTPAVVSPIMGCKDGTNPTAVSFGAECGGGTTPTVVQETRSGRVGTGTAPQL